MKKNNLSVILTLTLLALAAVAAWGATASFTPSPQGGTIFAVINADRSAGATTTSISVSWGSSRRTVIRGNPYGSCAGQVAGFVLMVPNSKPDARLFTLSTTGTIVRSPYQGVAPPEVGHSCYKLERIRLR
jgi:hypothetical protein